MPGVGQWLWDLCLQRSDRLLAGEARGRYAHPADGFGHWEGLRLLKENLTPRQQNELEVFNYFDVVGGVTGTLYRIRFGDRMNVEQLDRRGKCRRVLCFVPEGRLPVGDTMLAQKIALELFETEALHTANQLFPWQANPPFDIRY